MLWKLPFSIYVVNFCSVPHSRCLSWRRTTTRPSSPTRPRKLPSMSLPRSTSGPSLNIKRIRKSNCFYIYMVFTDWYWAIPRNILYVKEAEMKIGLETTLSFLWKVSFSSPTSPSLYHSFSGWPCEVDSEARKFEQARQARVCCPQPRGSCQAVGAGRHHRQGHYCQHDHHQI